mmetsp:Transcript_25910/g.36196  ORF Transcript_25910/g.36196 Transcript_25910/m.36196 type:complete len:92 (-) Transcript_25910:2270-2545(-)
MPATTNTISKHQHPNLQRKRKVSLSLLSFLSMTVRYMKMGNTKDVPRQAVAPRKLNTVSTPGTFNPRYRAPPMKISVATTCNWGEALGINK